MMNKMAEALTIIAIIVAIVLCLDNSNNRDLIDAFIDRLEAPSCDYTDPPPP